MTRRLAMVTAYQTACPSPTRADVLEYLDAHPELRREVAEALCGPALDEVERLAAALDRYRELVGQLERALAAFTLDPGEDP